MSDSELSDAPSVSLPPDREIESTLRDQVKKAAQGPLEDYTVSKIRSAVENSLGLSAGFFKGDEKWKPRSKEIIEKQVAIESGEAAEAPESTPKKAQQSKAKPKKPAKRGSPEEKPRPRKKQKLESDDETSALSSPPSASDDDFETKPKTEKGAKDKKTVTAKPKAKAKPKSKPKSKKDASDDENGQQSESDAAGDKANGSDSEMSVVLEEEPAKKRSWKSKSTDPSDKKSNPTKSRPKTSSEPDPDQEEVKRLQGWLVKCGIRKVWGKELKPFETPRAKIKHLKEMLSDAGMSGRYSNEKAAQIKEARELAADIEAVQEGNERWGKSDDDDGGDGDDGDLRTRGGRRLVRGAKNYDFLSSDGEETD